MDHQGRFLSMNLGNCHEGTKFWPRPWAWWQQPPPLAMTNQYQPSTTCFLCCLGGWFSNDNNSKLPVITGSMHHTSIILNHHWPPRKHTSLWAHGCFASSLGKCCFCFQWSVSVNGGMIGCCFDCSRPAGLGLSLGWSPSNASMSGV